MFDYYNLEVPKKGRNQHNQLTTYDNPRRIVSQTEAISKRCIVSTSRLNTSYGISNSSRVFSGLNP